MNKIKVSLDYNTITVKQYVDFISNEGNEVGQVSAILGQSKDFVRQLAPDQLQNAINAFRSIIEQPQASKQNRWKDYGFVPDINAISFGEWLDLDSNCKDFPKNLNKILAILYRPISNQLGNKYTIEPYTSAHLKNADDFNEMPLSIANGALVFFSTIEKELVNTSLQYLDSEVTRNLKEAMMMMEEALQQANSHQSTDGFTSLKN
jgi:hypothetical protein